ncbi:aspartate 1-decarboxylase [Mycoplasmatota bacterium WC44]
MFIEVLQAKIHRAVVTDADLNYVGSITIDKDLLDASGIIPGQKVQIVNNNNGARLETYVLEGEAGSGTMCLNGAAARLVQKEDVIIVIAYTFAEVDKAKDIKPKLVFVDENNKIKEVL